MNYQQIFDKLAAKHLVRSVEEDLARLAGDAMSYLKHGSISDPYSYIFPKLMLRWNCVLEGGAEISAIYKQKTALVLAVSLHKHGLADAGLTRKALDAIKALNDDVVLSDAFYRAADDIARLLLSPPVPLKKRPAHPESVTFYRAQDVLSIQLRGTYYAAYVHEIFGVNESPVIEFYDRTFDHVPSLIALQGAPAKGERYNDGVERISLYGIWGMKYLPDTAHQIQLISACVPDKPSYTHLAPPVGLFCVSDLFQMQREIDKLFVER